MGASGCSIVFSKNDAKCMYFLLDKKNKAKTRGWHGFLKSTFWPSWGWEMDIK